MNDFQNFFAQFAGNDVFADVADFFQIFATVRAGGGNVEQAVVPDNALARRIFALRPAFAPGGKFAQNGQQAAVVRPVFDFLPDVFGMYDIGFRVGKSGKFFVKPVSAAAFGQFAAQMFINGYQMGNVGKRIFKLFGVQRAQTPVGKAAAFV